MKCLEEALRKSEMRLKAVQRIARIGDWEWEIPADRILWSDELFCIYGYEPQEVAPDLTIMLDSMHLCREEFIADIETCLKEGKDFETESVYSRRDGSETVLRTTARVSRKRNGRPQLLTGTVQEITEHRQMVRLLAEKEARLRTMVQTIPDLVWLKDAAGVYLLCNTIFERFFGAREADITGKTDYDFVDRKLADFFRQHDLKAMAAGEPSSNEEWVTFADDGHDALLDTIKTPMYDVEGKLIGVLGIARDITSRKHTEDALRESEELFRLAFEQGAEGIVFSEYGTGKIVYANATIGKIFGHSQEELLAGGRQLLYGHFEEELVISLPDVLLQKDFLSTRVRVARNDGTELVISLRLRLVRVGGKELEYLSVRDMTEKVHLENEAKESQARLIHANKMSSLGMLVSGMAHEINNPNNFIMFNSGMLADIWNDADRILNDYFRKYGEFSLGGLPYPEVGTAASKLIAGINEGSQRIKIIVDDLKDFSRQDTLETNREMDVNEAVLKAAAILTPHIKTHTVNFHMHLQESIPRNVGNVHKFEQVIINLLMNALQSLPDKQCGVTVSTAMKDENTIIVVIKDEGGGMTGETMARLAEPFFTTKNASAGTGLGLFISKSLLTTLNGNLRFESEPGTGTSAIIELPIRHKDINQ
ncbi:MAG: PAS domain S-box protein [Desulfuromonadales bacterium]